METGFIFHTSSYLHDMGEGHPESPDRLRAIDHRLHTSGLDQQLQRIEAKRATAEALARAHTASHIDQIFSCSPEQGLASLDSDTAMCPDSLQAALHAAGASEQAVDLVMSGELQRVFCAVRPPGHHATQDRSMGFCLFNNIAVGALHAVEQHGLERVAIIDFDVHHGNGTEDIVGGHPSILFCSTFQHPFYPFSGQYTDHNNVINYPLPAGSSGSLFREIFIEQILPALETFKPELIFISAGFDAHSADRMAGLYLETSDYEWVTRKLCGVANHHCNGRVISTLEGGYALDALADSVVAHIGALVENG